MTAVGEVALDHVGVVTRDLAGLAEQYLRLGFRLTPFARQADGRIGNRCAMLHGGYIELLAAVDPQRGSATLERFLRRHAGAHILAFSVADIEQTMTRLGRAGVTASAAEFERATDDTDPGAPRARFKLLSLPEQPEGRLNLVQHLTPDALWQPRFLQHQNNAAALHEMGDMDGPGLLNVHSLLLQMLRNRLLLTDLLARHPEIHEIAGHDALFGAPTLAFEQTSLVHCGHL